MPLKKICYWIEKREHVRIVSAFEKMRNIDQFVFCPSFIRPKIPIAVRKYNDAMGFKGLIKRYKPDVITLSNPSEGWMEKFKKYGIKTAFIHHGIHDMVTSGNFVNLEQWKAFDIIFTGTNSFKKILEQNGINVNVVTNTLPQLDVLYDRIMKRNMYRKQISKKNPGATKIITLFGHPMGKKAFAQNNKIYFDIVFKLQELAEKYNWLVIVKPKKDDTNIYAEKAALNGDIPADYFKRYCDINKSKYIDIVSYASDPYVYFCSDAMICTGRSTAHIEAALARIPLGLIGFGDFVIDTLDAAKCGAGYIFKNQDNFENELLDLINNKDMAQKQKEYINSLGLKFDGKMHERLVDELIKLIDKK